MASFCRRHSTDHERISAALMGFYYCWSHHGTALVRTDAAIRPFFCGDLRSALIGAALTRVTAKARVLAPTDRWFAPALRAIKMMAETERLGSCAVVCAPGPDALTASETSQDHGMPFKTLIQCFVPPVLWGAAHQIKFALHPPPPPPEPPPPPPPIIPLTEIRFSSWAEACGASSSYENELLVRFRVARFILNAKKDLIPDITSRPLFWLTRILGENLRITDFGGAFGEYGTGLCRRINGIDYTVVETPAMLAQSPALERVTMTDEMPQSCDIFYCGGALQYLAHPYDVLDAGFKSARKALVLSRNTFSEQETFRVQASPLFDNGFGEIPDGFENEIMTHPLRIMREDHVHSLAAAHGFTLLSRFLEPSVFPDPEVYSAQLVFVRGEQRPAA